MPAVSSLVAFAVLSFVLIVIPGPSVLFVVSRAVALGRRAALVTVAGNATGVYLQVLLVAAGLGAIVERSIVAFTVVKLFGAAYLVWLGVQAIRHRRRRSGMLEAPPPAFGSRAVFRDGLVVGVANPKAIVFFASFLPQYVSVDGGPAALQMAVLGLVFVAIAVVSDGAWGLAAGTAREWLVRSPRGLERLAATGGAAIVGLGVHLAVAGRAD